MNSDPNISIPGVKKTVTIKVLGVGGAGGNAVEHMAQAEFTDISFAVLNTDAQALERSKVSTRFNLGTQLTRGLGAGGDPDVGRASAEADRARIQELCAGADVIFIVAGLGGGTGTGAGPVIAKIARETGALVLGVVTLPFDCEGGRRQRQAQFGLQQLQAAADGVICLPNQKILKLIDENTSLVETFKITNELLAQGVRGVWRLLTRPGIINVDFADLCTVVRGRHAESCLATAEARGESRGREVMEKILANPMLDSGQALSDAEAVLVSITGGPDLTMTEVSRLMEQVQRQCENAHIIMGAAIEPEFTERLLVTVIASRKAPGAVEDEMVATTQLPATRQTTPTDGPNFDTQFFHDSPTPRPASRFIAPAPELPPEKKVELLTRQNGGTGKQRKSSNKLRQGTLPLDIISRGRFEKSEPTIHQGEDLDVPTYIRRGVPLN